MKAFLWLYCVLCFVGCCGAVSHIPSQSLNSSFLTGNLLSTDTYINIPWLASMPDNCQGIVLTPWLILSTANCLKKSKLSHVDISGVNDPESIPHGQRTCLHPNFDPQDENDPVKADIGLVILEEPLLGDEIPLSQSSNVSLKSCSKCQYKKCDVYEYQSSRKLGTTKVKKIAVQLLDFSTCHHQHSYLEKTEGLCIQSQPREDCWIQRASPVLCLLKKHWQVVGLIHKTSRICQNPTVIIRTAPYFSWMKRFIKASKKLLNPTSSLRCGKLPENEHLPQIRLSNNYIPTLTSPNSSLRPFQGNLDISLPTKPVKVLPTIFDFSDANPFTDTYKLFLDKSLTPQTVRFSVEQMKSLPIRFSAEQMKSLPIRFSAEQMKSLPIRFSAEQMKPLPIRFSAEQMKPLPIRFSAEQMKPLPIRFSAEQMKPLPIRFSAEQMKPLPIRFSAEQMKPLPIRFSAEQMKPLPIRFSAEQMKPLPIRFSAEQMKSLPIRFSAEQMKSLSVTRLPENPGQNLIQYHQVTPPPSGTDSLYKYPLSQLIFDIAMSYTSPKAETAKTWGYNSDESFNKIMADIIGQWSSSADDEVELGNSQDASKTNDLWKESYINLDEYANILSTTTATTQSQNQNTTQAKLTTNFSISEKERPWELITSGRVVNKTDLPKEFLLINNTFDQSPFESRRVPQPSGRNESWSSSSHYNTKSQDQPTTDSGRAQNHSVSQANQLQIVPMANVSMPSTTKAVTHAPLHTNLEAKNLSHQIPYIKLPYRGQSSFKAILYPIGEVQP